MDIEVECRVLVEERQATKLKLPNLRNCLNWIQKGGPNHEVRKSWPKRGGLNLFLGKSTRKKKTRKIIPTII